MEIYWLRLLCQSQPGSCRRRRLFIGTAGSRDRRAGSIPALRVLPAGKTEPGAGSGGALGSDNALITQVTPGKSHLAPHLARTVPNLGSCRRGKALAGFEGCWKHGDSTVGCFPCGFFPLCMFFPHGFFPLWIFPSWVFPLGTFLCSWLVCRRKLIRIIRPCHGPMALVPLPEQLLHLQRRARPPKSPPAPSLPGVGPTLGTQRPEGDGTGRGRRMRSCQQG